MMNRKRALFFFLISVVVCLLLALFQPFSENTVSKYQKMGIDATMLNHGETGKILKELNIILPVENRNKVDGPASNVLEVASRATKDRRKWTAIDQYKEYRDKGIFCYFEIESKGPDFPCAVFSKKNGTWQEEIVFKIYKGRKNYAFFLDLSGTDIPLFFTIKNKSGPFTVFTMAFLQPGYHPLIFADRVSFSRILSDVDKGRYTLEPSAIVFNSHEKENYFKTKLRFKESWMAGVSKFQKKQGSTRIEMVPKTHHPLINGREKKNKEFADLSKGGLPIISIDVQEDDLYSDDYGILKNFAAHGRDWERLSHVQYFRDGEQVIAGFTGLRLQGGDPGREKGLINFRLFFRKEYGKSSVDGSKIFDRPTGVIKRLAVKQSEWNRWPLNTPLAYDISYEIGALSPPTEPVILYLNNKKLGLYYVVPHLGERQLEEMLPEGQYKYYRWRGAQHQADREFYQNDFWMKLGYFQEEITEKFAEQFFDLDNLINQVFSYLYNGTEDFCQGVAVKSTVEGAKMFWLLWDMDHSFADVNLDINNKRNVERERWEQPPYIDEFFTPETEKSQHYCPRVRFFRRLVNDDSGFRKKVQRVFMEIINHRISDETISELLYEAWSDLTKADFSYRDEYISALSNFFRNRKQFLIRQMEQDLPAAPVKYCDVDADHFPVQVDGYTKLKRYTGYYFPGSTLVLEADENSTFKHWLIDGKIHQSHKVAMVVSSDQECQIKAVFH